MTSWLSALFKLILTSTGELVNTDNLVQFITIFYPLYKLYILPVLHSSLHASKVFMSLRQFFLFAVFSQSSSHPISQIWRLGASAMSRNSRNIQLDI